MTAKRSIESPQFEVLLKVKQADNPVFSFLQADCELHPFYRWKRDGKDEIVFIEKRCSAEYNAQTEKKGNSMNLLDMYGSSSDDDSDGEGGIAGAVLTTSNISSGVHETIMETTMVSAETANKNERAKNEEQRAERLKRAIMLRHHFANR